MLVKRQMKDRVDTNNSVLIREIYGIPLFGRDRCHLLKLLEQRWGKEVEWIATVNPEFVMNALKDREFMNILQSRTTFNVVDGIGLAWGIAVQLKINNYELRIIKIIKRLYWGLVEGVKVLGGRYHQDIISGVDLIDEFCKVAAKKQRTVFFLGGWEDRGEKTAGYFQQKYPGLKVAGTYAGNKVGEDEKILTILGKQKIDYLLVAYAMKSQEEWINRNLEKLECKVVIGLGRTFDYYSGALPRAPLWMQKVGLEWFYSLITDKGRRKRKLVLLKFLWKILTD